MTDENTVMLMISGGTDGGSGSQTMPHYLRE